MPLVHPLATPMKVRKLADVDDGDFGEVAESFPLLSDVLLVTDYDDVLEFTEQEVAGA